MAILSTYQWKQCGVNFYSTQAELITSQCISYQSNRHRRFAILLQYYSLEREITFDFLHYLDHLSYLYLFKFRQVSLIFFIHVFVIFEQSERKMCLHLIIPLQGEIFLFFSIMDYVVSSLEPLKLFAFGAKTLITSITFDCSKP